MEYASRNELADCLNRLLSSAGNAHLRTPELAATPCDHAVGNYRMFTGMASELLATAAQHELTTAFENHNAAQLRRGHQEVDRSQQDRLEDFNSDPQPIAALLRKVDQFIEIAHECNEASPVYLPS